MIKVLQCVVIDGGAGETRELPVAVLDGRLYHYACNQLVATEAYPVGEATTLRGWGRLDGPAHYIDTPSANDVIVPDAELKRAGVTIPA